MIAAGALAALVALYAFGPRNDWGPAVPTPHAPVPNALGELAPWLAARESLLEDIKPNNDKKVMWASEPATRTDWAVVYVHGFSASRLEMAPVAERVAEQLKANVFYTRLKGHGRSNPLAMASATPQDWMADVLEAARIGRLLGERVLMISASTGGTLATWLGTTEHRDLVAAHAMISPNFGPKDPRAEIINMPWGTHLASLIQGPTRSWQPKSEAEANAWTSQYPTAALFPMMDLVRQVRESDLQAFHTPALVVYSPRDQTVEPRQILEAFDRLGSTRKQLVAFTQSSAEGQHVLAGAITAPESVEPMVQQIVAWVTSIGLPQ